MPDGARPYCSHCLEDFDALNRRHHCRCCGSLFCGACSSNFTRLPGFGIEAPARVCERCLEFETEQLPLLLAGDVFIKPGAWTGARNLRYVWLSYDQAELCWAPWVAPTDESAARCDDGQAKRLALASLVRSEESEGQVILHVDPAAAAKGAARGAARRASAAATAAAAAGVGATPNTVTLEPGRVGGGDLATLWAAALMALLSIEATRRQHERTEPSP